jgi:predicted nucleic acid-binding protein
MLFDTNVVSDYLRPDAAKRLPATEEFVRTALETDNLKIAFATQFELLRLRLKDALAMKGRRKLVELRKFLDRCEVLGLDLGGGVGWTTAAELWAQGRAKRPAIVFSDGDLIIAATASLHGETLVTFDAKLAKNLEAIGYANVLLLPRE